MYTLTAHRGFNIFRFQGTLDTLIVQAGEYDSASVTDPDGTEVYAVAFEPMTFKKQAC